MILVNINEEFLYVLYRETTRNKMVVVYLKRHDSLS